MLNYAEIQYFVNTSLDLTYRKKGAFSAAAYWTSAQIKSVLLNVEAFNLPANTDFTLFIITTPNAHFE
jgi:hypothetical protein